MQALDITVSASGGAQYFEVFLVPADGQSRLVLRWGSTPRDLDFYVIPRNVQNAAGGTQAWATIYQEEVLTHLGGQPPYLSWDVNGFMCECAADTVPCDPTCFIQSVKSGFGFDTKISLDRDDTQHGIVRAPAPRAPRPAPRARLCRPLQPVTRLVAAAALLY